MITISFLAIGSMYSSVFISETAESDALAINNSGMLRMKSYKVLYLLNDRQQPGSQETAQALILDLEQRLNSHVLSAIAKKKPSSKLANAYQQVLTNWHDSLKPMFMEALTDSVSSERLNRQVEQFVLALNELVLQYQRHAESNMTLIRLILGVALFSTVILVAFGMFIVHRKVEMPLSDMTRVAKQIARGDFTGRLDESSKDELGLLAHTINNMSISMYRSQAQLEAKVQEKTTELKRSNDSIQLLYKISNQLNDMQEGDPDFTPVMKQLANITGVEDIDLCIMTASGTAPYTHLMTAEKELAVNCIKQECGHCISFDPKTNCSTSELKYPLNWGDENYGALVCHPFANHRLEEWKHQLFNSVADQIATGLSVKQQREQSRRLALMNERTVIARELHDSLAQALSYLKIQVTLLQKLRGKENNEEKMSAVIEELKTGLGSAYRELRELLTTFRLKIDGQNLQQAFEQTITQLQSRDDDIQFQLNFDAGNIPFSPQEEIHLLQITREATQNAFYHSKGSHIEINLFMDNNSHIQLQIKDNGIGIPDDPNKLNHYGLAIMQERSRSLGGTLTIEPLKECGTGVFFEFQPDYIKNSALSEKRA